MPTQEFRLLVTGDLHYDLHGKNRGITRALADHVNRARADAFAIVGDVVGGNMALLGECLRLFDRFRGVRLIIPGNHDLWTIDGDSEQAYREEFPRVAAEAGFQVLDGNPVCFGSVGVVGNVSWYDYSFRDPRMNLSDRDYESKTLPGCATFNDGRFIRWRYSDREFSELCVKQLQTDIRRVRRRAELIVALTHFLPFRELIPQTQDVRFMFARAYVGARGLGAMLRRFKAVRYVFCGHIHLRQRARIGHIDAFSLAGGRGVNMVFDLKLPEGRVRAREFRE